MRYRRRRYSLGGKKGELEIRGGTHQDKEKDTEDKSIAWSRTMISYNNYNCYLFYNLLVNLVNVN